MQTLQINACNEHWNQYEIEAIFAEEAWDERTNFERKENGMNRM